MTKFLVIGHLCMDVYDDGGRAGKDMDSGLRWGGIFFSLATLANLAEDARIYPVFGVGKDEHELFLQRLQPYSTVETSGIFRLAGPTNRVSLIHQSRDKRIECSRFIASPIPFERIEPYLDVDVILVNMISGFDLTLETLTQIRMQTKQNHVFLHLDLHSLTLGIDEEHRRFPRPVETWRRWCYLADTVQMNEEEAKTLPLEYLQEEDLAKQVLSLGLQGLVITRGDRGATVWSQEHKRISRKDIGAMEVDRPIDTIGCGDVFGAAFCYHFARYRGLEAAAEFGNRVAALKVPFQGSDGIDTLSQIQKPIETPK